jgi:hypothetical protein
MSIPAICENATAPLLATTSINGIVGTWNPATCKQYDFWNLYFYTECKSVCNNRKFIGNGKSNANIYLMNILRFAIFANATNITTDF